MRILLVSSIPPPEGGISTWTLKYLSCAGKYGLDIDLVNIAPIGRRGKKINAKMNVIDEIKRTFRIITDMKRAVLSKKYDLVHINTSCSVYGIHRDAWCVRIAKKYNIPIVLHCRCNIEDRLKHIGASIRAFKQMVNNSHLIIVLNKKSYRYVESFGNYNLKLLPNFIEAEYCFNKNTINKSIKDILFVGHVERAKGIFELIEAAKAFPDITFTVIGPVNNEVMSSDIPQNVNLLGNLNRDEIKQHYFSSDLFLFPSYSEGFSNAVLEAMSMGLPVIATDVGANKDMIEDCGGIIIQPQKSGEIIEAISIMYDKKRREESSKWNYQKVLSTYTVDKVMEKLCTYYFEIEKS